MRCPTTGRSVHPDAWRGMDAALSGALCVGRDPERLTRFIVAANRVAAAETLVGALRQLVHAARLLAGADHAELAVVPGAPSVGGRIFRSGTAGSTIGDSLERDVLVDRRLYARLRLTTARTAFLPVEHSLVDVLCLHGSLALERLSLRKEGELVAQIREAVGAAHEPNPSVAVRDVGGIHLDLARYQASVAGRPVHLTPSEFRLLELLSEQPGRAYSRREIASRLWDTSTPTSLRIADAHVTGLRRKIEDDPQHPTRVLTVRGVGYRLSGD